MAVTQRRDLLSLALAGALLAVLVLAASADATYYRIVNKETAWCLEASQAGTVALNPCQASNNAQLWERWDRGWTRNASTGLCLEAAGVFSAGSIGVAPCVWDEPRMNWLHWYGGWYERAAFDSQGVSNPPECLSRLASSHAVTGVACDNPLGPNPPSELWYAVEATPSPPSPQKPASPQLDPCRPLRTSKGLRLRVKFRRSRRVATASYGRRLRVHARLVTASGAPVVGAGFCIGVQTVGHAQVRAVGLRATDARGRFSYLLGRGGTRRVWFMHHGDGQSASGSVLVRVRAPVTLRASPRSLRNGQTVVLRGRLGGRQHIRGLLVELQAWRDRRWVPFCLSRTNRAGHFRCAYRFTHSVGVHTYRMRARVAAQVGSPFETGTSRPVRVRVSG